MVCSMFHIALYEVLHCTQCINRQYIMLFDIDPIDMSRDRL